MVLYNVGINGEENNSLSCAVKFILAKSRWESLRVSMHMYTAGNFLWREWDCGSTDFSIWDPGLAFDKPTCIILHESMENSFIFERFNLYRSHRRRSWQLGSISPLYFSIYWGSDFFSVMEG